MFYNWLLISKIVEITQLNSKYKTRD